MPEFFSRSAVPPGSLNSEFFCLQMFSLFYFYREMREIRSFPVFFLQQFWQQGQVRAGDERLRAKASGEVAGLESLRFGGLFFVTEVQTRATE